MPAGSSSSELQTSADGDPARPGRNAGASASAYRRSAPSERWSSTSRGPVSHEPYSRWVDSPVSVCKASSGVTTDPPNGQPLPNVRSQPSPILSAYRLAKPTSSDHSALSQSGRVSVSIRPCQVGSSHASSTPPKPLAFSQLS
jgi:hypothetical protein